MFLIRVHSRIFNRFLPLITITELILLPNLTNFTFENSIGTLSNCTCSITDLAYLNLFHVDTWCLANEGVIPTILPLLIVTLEPSTLPFNGKLGCLIL
jgi:hypothetical protein